MLQVYVLNVSSTADVRCIQVLCVSNVCLESHGARPMRRGKGRGELGPADGVRTWCLADGAYSSSSRLSSPACAEREEGFKEKERRARDGARRMGTGYACVTGQGRWGRTTSTPGDCGTFLLGHSIPSDGIPSDIRADSHASLHDKEGSVCLTSPHSITVLDPLKKKRSTTALPSGVLDKIISLYSRAESIPSVTTSLLAWTLLIGIDLTNNKCSNQPLSEHPACHVPKEFSLDAPYTATAIPRFLACCFPIVVQSI
jgi:hypothetical protein